MASVTFPTTVGGDGSTVTDDTNASTGLDAGGHRTRFVPALAQIGAIASYIVNLCTAALNGAATSATSTTSLTIGTGAKSFTLAQTGKGFALGQTVAISSNAGPTNQMIGIITAFVSGTGAMTVQVSTIGGSGTLADWTIAVSATAGVSSGRQVIAGGLVTGGGDLTADRTLTVTAAAASDVRTGTDTTKALTAGALVSSAATITLTDAATVAWDVANGYNATVTMAGNRTIGAPTNLKDGITYTLELVQDATGSRVPSWNAIWDFGAAGTPTLQTAANKRDKVFGQYNSATSKIDASFRKGA